VQLVPACLHHPALQSQGQLCAVSLQVARSLDFLRLRSCARPPLLVPCSPGIKEATWRSSCCSSCKACEMLISLDAPKCPVMHKARPYCEDYG
jgi:hypothetical protein